MFVSFEGEMELACAECLGGGDVVFPVIAWCVVVWARMFSEAIKTW